MSRNVADNIETVRAVAAGAPRTIQRTGLRCERCGHDWIPRDIAVPPRVCPRCKSPYWDRPRKTETKGKAR